MKQNIPHIALVILVALAVTASGCKKMPGSNMGFTFFLATTGAVPKVLSSMPANEATGVSITPTISARFSMDMNPSTMTTGNITISGGTKGDITGTVVYNEKQRTATFVLVSPASLEYLTDYTVTINDDAKSKYGKNLANDVQWSFTTVAEGTVPAPELTPLPGTHDNAVAVSITCDDASASIRYTIDGTTVPTHDIGTPYGGPGTLEITGNTLLRTVAYRTGWVTSSVTEGQYNIRTASPTFDPTGDQYSTNQQVTISAPGATIYYTLTTGSIASPPEDPAIPTTGSTVFSSLAPIPVQGDNTMVKIKAMAVKAGMAQSLVVSKSYSIAWETAGAPSFNDPEGTYTGTKHITLSSTTDSATIHYTTDEVTEPSRTVGIEYTNPVEVSHNMVIKAIAFKDEYKRLFCRHGDLLHTPAQTGLRSRSWNIGRRCRCRHNLGGGCRLLRGHGSDRLDTGRPG